MFSLQIIKLACLAKFLLTFLIQQQYVCITLLKILKLLNLLQFINELLCALFIFEIWNNMHITVNSVKTADI